MFQTVRVRDIFRNNSQNFIEIEIRIDLERKFVHLPDFKVSRVCLGKRALRPELRRAYLRQQQRTINGPGQLFCKHCQACNFRFTEFKYPGFKKIERGDETVLEKN